MKYKIGQVLKDIEERIPLKQGLKPFPMFSLLVPVRIEERIPLKQGLKLYSPLTVSPLVPIIEERIPLKQGLKQSMVGYMQQNMLELKREFH